MNRYVFFFFFFIVNQGFAGNVRKRKLGERSCGNKFGLLVVSRRCKEDLGCIHMIWRRCKTCLIRRKCKCVRFFFSSLLPSLMNVEHNNPLSESLWLVIHRDSIYPYTNYRAQGRSIVDTVIDVSMPVLKSKFDHKKWSMRDL